MFQTLELVNAALARVQPHAARHREAHRQPPDLRRVPHPGLQPDVRHDSADARSGRLANYDIKPRLNRVNGVSMVVVQGGQVPEFQIEPDPAKLLQAQVTVPGILDAVGRSNMIDSPGLIENNHELCSSLVSGQTRDARRDRQHRGQDHAGRRAGAHRRHRHSAAFGDAGLHDRHRQRQAGRAAEYLPPAGQQHRRGGRSRCTPKSTRSGKTLPPGVKLQPFYDQSELVQRFHRQRARRDPASAWFWRR